MGTLPCVWPLALRSSSRSEVDAWFGLRLRRYLRFLKKSLISSTSVQNATCLAFQKLVSIMGNNYTYNTSEFGQGDIYATIKTYLSIGSGARCYNASDTELNSTAWFVNNIGTFVTFITLDDLNTFVSSSQISVFLENQANIELFNNTAIPENVTSYYTTQLYTHNPSFSPVLLPGVFLCSAPVPSSVYSSLGQADSIHILDNLKTFCNGTNEPEVSAALASNFQTFTASTFETLGSASAGLTSSQISLVSPSMMVSSLGILASVSRWNQGQASQIIQIIFAGGFEINSASSLQSLGTLVGGVPSSGIASIPATTLLSASQSSTFVANMLAAPQIIQQTYVTQIITLDQSPASVVLNVPDAMASEIPRPLLAFSETVDVQVINRKTWRQEQAAVFFGTVASTDFDTEELSPSVLQGFTCTSVQRITTRRIRRLVRACRPRRRRAKVVLKETQLTCMHNLLSENLSQNFTDYPSDMLLYFNYNNVERINCRSYFSALGDADFSVLSSVLNRESLLLNNARSCLGISGVNLSKDNVEVLGNMACSLDSSYIQSSDPLILEKLKACKDFSDSQVAAMETLLLSGQTPYGNSTSWDRQTLENLGPLPLYFTRNFWGLFKRATKKNFLKSFMPRLRRKATARRKLKRLFKQINSLRSKRGSGCIVGNITQVTISDASFPFGYDKTQFDLCLDVPVLKDNLNSICEKVDDNDFQRIILEKVNQAYPSGIADEQVQLLGSVARVASLDDISKWNITKIDTLAALMDSDDGSWEAAKSKAIITKYLNTSGNSLGSAELNTIGSNLCSLNTTMLGTITPDSIRNANPLNVASCSTEQKRVLYEISNSSFSSERANAAVFYQLIHSYLGGAPLSEIRALSTQNISMDIATFKSLDSSVIAALTVTDVKGLLGTSLQDLKLFENETVVTSWVNLQLQSDLDTLGLNLITTRVTPSVNATASSNSTSNATAAVPTTGQGSTTLSTAATTTQVATTSGGAELAEHPASIFLPALLTFVLQLLL